MQSDGVPSSAERADGERVARGSLPLPCYDILAYARRFSRATPMHNTSAASRYGEKGIYPNTSTVQIHTGLVNHMRHARQHLSITSTLATFEESSVPIYWIQNGGLRLRFSPRG